MNARMRWLAVKPFDKTVLGTQLTVVHPEGATTPVNCMISPEIYCPVLVKILLAARDEVTAACTSALVSVETANAVRAAVTAVCTWVVVRPAEVRRASIAETAAVNPADVASGEVAAVTPAEVAKGATALVSPEAVARPAAVMAAAQAAWACVGVRPAEVSAASIELTAAAIAASIVVTAPAMVLSVATGSGGEGAVMRVGEIPLMTTAYELADRLAMTEAASAAAAAAFGNGAVPAAPAGKG
jgi:hypothetical protein